MLPIELDYRSLSSLPTPSEHSIRKVLEVLNGIITQKTVPYFRNQRGTDLIQLANVKQNISIHRMEDDSETIRMASLVTLSENKWRLHIHERLFGFLAFVIPLKSELAIGNINMEERKMLAFCEFLLRHNIEHFLYPERKEQDVIRSDIDFAMAWQRDDPTSYRMLKNALADDMNGLNGARYLQLLENAEQGKSNECAISRVIHDYGSMLSDLPTRILADVFPQLEVRLQTIVLGNCFRKSRKNTYPLVKRASNLQKIMSLFSALHKTNRQQAFAVLAAFEERWGLAKLLQELDMPEAMAKEAMSEQFFRLLESQKKDFQASSGNPARFSHAEPPPTASSSKAYVHDQPAKSLKERIEDARSDPYFPPAVLDLIDKNKTNAAGQSGSKYSELIETLLSIPWGRIIRIAVTPSEFEEGLNKSHYGLRKPKEIIADFFSNLIWRYQHFRDFERRNWKKTGSALLFVGPPGVGKTSLAISIARNLGIPFHKISLGGLRDEADIRGYGFTYEGSKPGPIVQGLIKMGAMNGMFILDEVDKTEKFAIATLLEILDPEQNHLFHDKYTQSTIDIDLSNSHFVLTANTLETVPPPVLDRCEVIFLNRYSVDEKIAIAKEHLIQRVREKYMIGEREIFFDNFQENDLLRYLIKNFTFEAGVRDLERIIRTLLLRIHRKEIIARGRKSVRITKEKIKEFLDEPNRPRLINEDDRVGEMMGLGVNMEMGTGSLIPIQATPLRTIRGRTEGRGSFTSIIHATGNIERVMDESRKVASTAISHLADDLGIDLERLEEPVHLHFMGASTKKDGPSAGGAIALSLASLFRNRKIRRDVAMTGEVDTQGRVTGIGGLSVKLETAYSAGCKTMIIPKENMYGEGGISQIPDGLKQELQILTYDQWKNEHEPFDYNRHVMQVVAVDHILQAADIAFIDQEEVDALEERFVQHADMAVEELNDAMADPFRRLRIVYIDDPDELDTDFFRSGFCEKDHGCVILLHPEIKDDVTLRLIDVQDRISAREFDPSRETLTEVLHEIRDSFSDDSSPPLRMSLIAPLAVLKKDGIRMEDFPADDSFLGLRLFSSCCTVENAQINSCRKLINRTYRQLARMSGVMIENSPFIVRKNGIYMVSLSFIPEKYRLDSKRAEEILNRCLARWLDIMEEHYNRRRRIPKPSVVKR